MRIRVDEMIRRTLVPLREDELQLLEQSVLAEGIRNPLVVWNRDGEYVLLDGHHRYDLAQKHGLTFSTVEMRFDSYEEAVQWVLQNQLARRNLSDEQRRWQEALQQAQGVEYYIWRPSDLPSILARLERRNKSPNSSERET